MLVKSWEQIPFAIGVNNLLEEKSITNLPFGISCGTQQGLDHFENSTGNQDAISLLIENDFLVAVICDGCTSSNINSVNEFTSNQVGANLLSKKTASLVRNLIKIEGVKSIQENINKLQFDILNYLNKFVNELGDDQDERQLLINNFCTATITVAAIDADDYCIINSGDGIAFVNGKKKELTFSPGVYLSSYLENKELNEPGFNLIEFGKTENISSIFISTDGFENDKILLNDHFVSYLNKKYDLEIKGFFDGLPEYRQTFLTPFIDSNEVFNQWPTDDASFIFLRRIEKAIINSETDEMQPYLGDIHDNFDNNLIDSILGEITSNNKITVISNKKPKKSSSNKAHSPDQDLGGDRRSVKSKLNDKGTQIKSEISKKNKPRKKNEPFTRT